MSTSTSTRERNAPNIPTPLTPAEIKAYLDYALEGLLTRRAEMIAALNKTATAHPTISSDETLGAIAENMRMAIALGKTGEDRRKEQKEPFLEGGRAVDGWFKAWIAPLSAAMLPVQASMNVYGELIERRNREAAQAERKRLDAIAERAQADAERALRENRSEAALDALDAASEAAQAADDAGALAESKPAELTRTYGNYGAVTSMRQSWSWEIANLAIVPRAYLMVNPDAIKAAAKQRDTQGKPAAVIPGIRWVVSKKMGVR